MSQQSGPKLLYINNLRTVLITLIVMLHIAITYGATGSWYYYEHTGDVISAVLLTLFTAVVQSFVLGFFFMISGYLTPGSYARKGPRTYLKGRFIRLGIPLVVYFFGINPLIVYTLYVRSMGDSVRLQDFFGTGPLWFVQALLIFCVGYTLWKVLSPENVSGLKQQPQSSQILVFVLMLSLANFLVRIWWPIGESFSNLQFGFFPGYVSLFVIGIIAYDNKWFDNFSDSVGMRWLKLAVPAIFLFPVIGVMGGAVEDVTPFLGGIHWQSLAYSLWEAFVGAGLIAGLFVLFRKRFDSQTSFTRTLSDNAYTVFIIHAPVIVFVSYALRGLPIFPLLKFALVSVLGVSLCFVISHCIVRRIPYSEKVL
ncbi:MAG: acyltransferase family protein [Methanomicrobia archaeon]|nr:acyltransferase family protein [Methanomicrobia archaeon]